MLKRLDKDRWKILFELVEDCAYYGDIKTANGSSVSTVIFTIEDVEEIIAILDGCSCEVYGNPSKCDTKPWLGVFKLKDGRFVSMIDFGSVHQGDYPIVSIAESKKEIIDFGLTKEDRVLLNLLSEEERKELGYI